MILHKLASDPLIESTPKVCGGEPRIAGSRITVRTIEEIRRRGADISAIVRMYPWLEPRQIEAAFQYADAHRDEIEALIRAEEDA